MGSAYHRMREGRERALGNILNEGYKYLVVLVGTRKETNEPARGAYQLFKELDEPAIQEYARTTSEENGVTLEKIEIFSLEAKLLQELKPNLPGDLSKK